MASLLASNPHFTLFGIDIYYYAVIIVFGMIAGIVVATVLFKRRNMPVDWVLDLVLCVLPLAIIGARTYYCIFYKIPIQYWFSLDDQYGIRAGGLAIYGGVIFGALGVALFCLLHKVNFLRVADCVVPALILGQCIGRWGNFVNQEAYGNPVTDPAWQFFPDAVNIEGVGWRQATFFYESFFCLIAFLILLALAWKLKKRPHGMMLCGYMILYGCERTLIEGLRADSLMAGSVRVSQLLSVVIVVGGVALLLYLFYRNRKLTGKIIGAAVGEPLATEPKLYTKEQLKKKREEEEKLRAEVDNARRENNRPEI